MEILKDPVLALDPDFILLQWYVNDLEGEDKSGRPQPLMVNPSEIRENSAFVSLVHDLSIKAQEGLGLVGSYNEYMLARFGDPQSPASRGSEQALRTFIQICRERGLPVGIVLFGHYFSQDTSMDFLIDRVMEVCEQEGVTWVDLRNQFAPIRGDRMLWANWGDKHPSPLSHSMVADQLIDAFGEVWSSG